MELDEELFARCSYRFVNDERGERGKSSKTHDFEGRGLRNLGFVLFLDFLILGFSKPIEIRRLRFRALCLEFCNAAFKTCDSL